MGWFSSIGHALNPVNALNPVKNIRQTADNVGADVRRSWDAVQPVVKGAGDQIGRDFDQLGQGRLPSGPNFRQATDQIGRDLGASLRGVRIGADAAGRDTQQGFGNAQQAAQRMAQGMGQGMGGGGPMQAMPGGPSPFGPSPRGSKSPTPGGMMPGAPNFQGLQQGPGGFAPGMGPQGNQMAQGSFAPQGMGQPPVNPFAAKGGAGGAPGGLNPQQAAMTQAAMLRGGGPGQYQR